MVEEERGWREGGRSLDRIYEIRLSQMRGKRESVMTFPVLKIRQTREKQETRGTEKEVVEDGDKLEKR